MSESEPASGPSAGTDVATAAESGTGTCVGAEGGTSGSTVGIASINTLR